MYSLWSQRKRERAAKLEQKLRFKRTGKRTAPRAPPKNAVTAIRRSRAHSPPPIGSTPIEDSAHAAAEKEARVVRIYGQNTSELAARCDARTLEWTERHGPRLRDLRTGPAPTHVSLFRFKQRDRTKELHPRDYVSVAPDSLCPRAFLAGGGKLDAPRSALLRASVFGDRTALLGDVRNPPRLVQPPYRNAEYPLRERDPTADVGPAGGSQGGLIYKHFTDQERLEDTRSRQGPGSLSEGGRDPWDERATRRQHMPEFRGRPVKANWRSVTAPGGFHLTDPPHWEKTTTTAGNPNVTPSSLDAPWDEPRIGKAMAHTDSKEKWWKGKRFYTRSHLHDYQRGTVKRVQLGERTSIWRKPGHALSAGESVGFGRGRDLSNSLNLRDGRFEWADGSSAGVSENLNGTFVGHKARRTPRVSPVSIVEPIGSKAYFASSRSVSMRRRRRRPASRQ